jgi:hypothetical protein
LLALLLLAAPALGLEDRLRGTQEPEPAPLPMWLGLRPDGTFCVALASRCEDVDRARPLVFRLVDAELPLLRGYVNAGPGATLELVRSDGARAAILLRWVEAPGNVSIFAEQVALRPDPATLLLRGPDGRVIAREEVRRAG